MGPRREAPAGPPPGERVDLQAREDFSAAWLELREAADHQARSRELLHPLREAHRSRGWTRILDLGAGTGSNVRYLAPELPSPQEWTLLDRNPTLLARALDSAPAAGIPAPAAVAGDLEEPGLRLARRAHLVTGSALLDLVSRRWLRHLVEACRRGGAGVLFALTYDGRIGWDPADPDDPLVARAFNRHQRRDKGTGPALGPGAGREAEELLASAGYRTHVAPTPWRLRGRHRELAGALVEGWARAAREERPELAPRIDAWARRRGRTVERGGFRLLVGHLDVLAVPPSP